MLAIASHLMPLALTTRDSKSLIMISGEAGGVGGAGETGGPGGGDDEDDVDMDTVQDLSIPKRESTADLPEKRHSPLQWLSQHHHQSSQEGRFWLLKRTREGGQLFFFC